MLFDLNQLSEAPRTAYDVCVVGAGAAGIVLALKLAGRGKKVALCEAGGMEFTAESQECYNGEVIGDPYFDLDITRLRYFGGSTNHWGGWSRPFEPIDFDRGYLGDQYVWPISLDELTKYLKEASSIIDTDDAYDDVLVNDTHGVIRFEIKTPEPVRFGEKYQAELENSADVDVFLNANLTDIAGTGSRVTSATFASYQDRAFEISANTFVFAMGGIENSRQLLWLREKHGTQFMDNDLPIGRYWMEHPHFTLGEALVSNPISTGQFFALTGARQRELNTLNCGLRVEEQSGGATKRLVKDLMCVAPTVGRWAMELAGRNLICGARFRAAWEQAPAFDNRVGLSATKKDRFGVPQSELHWTISEVDRNTARTASDVFNQWLLDDDLGRIRLDEWVYGEGEFPTHDEIAGHHHMGGTRMSASKRYGVVDANCKVFGSDNLYVAGSSVFVTGGHNNPTLPLLQLTLRLADHLS